MCQLMVPPLRLVAAMKQSNPSHLTWKMLLVEDEPVLIAALTKYFTWQGFEVHCARELEEAEALIATTHYKIVIADLRLSGTLPIDGLSILRFGRQYSRGTRFIVLSALSSKEIQRSARAEGAEAFLSKPLPLAEISATIDRLLAVAS